MKKDIVNKCLDVLEITGKTALSVIPIGGALATAIYDAVKGNVLQINKPTRLSKKIVRKFYRIFKNSSSNGLAFTAD